MPVLREFCVQAGRWLAEFWGGEARRVQQRWARVLAGRPDLQADLADLGMLNVPDLDASGQPLSAEQLQFRAGARFVVLNLLGRARVTEDEWSLAMKGDHDEGMGILGADRDGDG